MKTEGKGTDILPCKLPDEISETTPSDILVVPEPQ